MFSLFSQPNDARIRVFSDRFDLGTAENSYRVIHLDHGLYRFIWYVYVCLMFPLDFTRDMRPNLRRTLWRTVQQSLHLGGKESHMS